MINKFINIRVIFIMFIVMVCYCPVRELFAADESQDFVSICDRTEQIRLAIQKEVAFQRFTYGVSGDVRCNAIRTSELKEIRSLQIVDKEISSLKPGDFSGLENLKVLNLEGNNINRLDSATLKDLINLESLILAHNAINSLGRELSVLNNLKHVDFSGCRISTIVGDTFSANQKLETVFLPDNQIEELPEGVFMQNHAFQIIDLARNRIRKLPDAFISEKNSLRILDISGNMTENIDNDPILKFKGFQLNNASNNPEENLNDQKPIMKSLNAAIGELTFFRPPHKARANNINSYGSPVTDSQNHVFLEVQKLRRFVRDHWHMPLNIIISFSSGEHVDLTNPGLRTSEERLLLRQLEEVREAYRRAAFDFFEVQINFVGPDSLQKTPSLSFNKKRIGFIIFLKASAEKSLRSSLITDDQMLDLLAENFERSHSINWFAKESPQDLEAAIKRDFAKVARLDDEIRFDIIRLDDLIDTAMERTKLTEGKDFFSNSELIDARLIQFRVMLAFQRLENTISRWKLAESDAQFPYRAEVRMLLSEASETYRTHLDGFVLTIVGGRATINILNKTWYHRNPIFKILDSEVLAGFFNLDGRISTRIPGGAVRDLLKSRLSLPLLHFLFWTRSLDEKVTTSDIEQSPLREEMIQAKQRIDKNRQTFDRVQISYARALKELWDARIKNSIKFPLYHVMVGVAGFIGDTRLSHPPPAITDEQMTDMKSHLKPGDLLIERTDYYLSNAFLGGFWPHGILYLGSKEEWSKMKLSDGTTLAEDYWIAEHILPYYHSEKDGRPAMVMEAISEGVVFNSLEEAAQKDYIAIFRPKFKQEDQEAKIAGIIKRALKYHGRSYDFDFDFFTDDKLVCTELLYRAYHPDINFLVQKEAVRKPAPPIPGMIKKAGRDTMPANEIAKLALYMLEHKEPDPSIGYAGQTLEFVRLYMKQDKDKPAIIYEGEQGIEVLRTSLQ